MTTADLVQSSPARVNALFAKLADTGNGALKTRETLFTALKEELDLHARLEERNLFPALRKHKETRDLIPDAMDDNRRVRALLAELDRTAKDDEGFPKRLAELRTMFQQHIRDEGKELLPAVRKALGADEPRAIARKRKPAKAKDAGRRPAAGRRVREAGAALARSATAAADGGLRTAGTMRSAVDAARPAADTLQVFAGVPHVAVGVMNEAARTWMEWVDQTRQSASRRADALTRCSSLREFTQAQGRFLQDAVDAWSNAAGRMVRISMRAAGHVFDPMERQAGRATDAARDTGRTRA